MTASRDGTNQHDMILLVGQTTRRDDTERLGDGPVFPPLPSRRETSLISVGNHVQFRLIPMRTQQTGAKLGRYVHMADPAIQPHIEQPIYK